MPFIFFATHLDRKIFPGMTNINTTERYNNYCNAKHVDGRRCGLYSPHPGGHLPVQGQDKDRWFDEVTSEDARSALDLAKEVFSQINQEVGIVEVDDGYLISVDNPHAIEIVLDTLDGLTAALGQPLVFQVSRELSTNKTRIHWKKMDAR